MLRMSPLSAVLVVQLVTASLTSAQPTMSAEQSAYGQPTNTGAPAAVASPQPDAPSKGADSRRLSPPSASRPSDESPQPRDSLLARFKIPQGSLPGTFAALAVVSGLLLLAMWGLKRSMPQSMHLLPAEAASVLGRMPLTGKQFAHLIKLGDKLVLVSISPTAVDTLTEVTDPDQVTRLVALCSSTVPSSVKHDFDQILQQLATEPTRSGFLGAGTIAATARGGYARA